MQQLKNLLPETSLSTSVEKYILTEEEELQAIAYAKEQFIKTKGKKMALVGFTSEQILAKADEYFTDNEIKKVLFDVNGLKHNEIWHHEQRQKRLNEEKERRQVLVQKCDANYFYKIMLKNSIVFGSKIEMSHYIRTLCFFFSNDDRLITGLNLDPNKGLWIRGKTGVGKTFPLMCLENNELIPFKVVSMLTVAQEVSSEGEYILGGFLKVLDDVGSEQNIVNHYGTKINWFKDLIELYYKDKKPFNRLIVTTNLDFKEVETNYGFRVRSRVREMFNVIDIIGEDLRK